jgi:hypothetical protein
MVILNEKRKYMKKAADSKLLKKLIELGYTDPSEAYHAIAKYLVTGKIVKPTKGKV